MGILVWKEVCGYEGRYLVSNDGDVKSLLSDKVLKPNRSNNGYLTVELFKRQGGSKRILIHRLVANAFIPNPNNLPIVNHKDENKQNNNVNNLEWCTQKYNANYGDALLKKKQNRKITSKVKQALLMGGVSRCKPILQFTKDNSFIKRYVSAKDAERNLNINHSHISEVCKGKRKSAGGYVWHYEN